MEPSEICIAFIKQKESCGRLDSRLGLYMPYPDSGGLSTIGWGHQLTHVDLDSGIFKYGLSSHGCDLLFLQDLKPVVTFVNSLGLIGLTQGQFDALVDFTYNCGAGTCKTLVNMGLKNIPTNLMHFVHDRHGSVLPGLISRRKQELAWWTDSIIK
jgi:GH24 family phage-related lysozyme (muramidase)